LFLRAGPHTHTHTHTHTRTHTHTHTQVFLPGSLLVPLALLKGTGTLGWAVPVGAGMATVGLSVVGVQVIKVGAQQCNNSVTTV
jgi:hypothetical protein